MHTAKDLTLVKAALLELGEFLLTDQIYWPLSAPVFDPFGYSQGRYSLGLVLLALDHGVKRSSTDVETALWEDISGQVWEFRSRYRTAWQNKTVREFRSRLRSWHDVLDELLQDRIPSNAVYRSNVRSRVILQFLGGELQQRSSDFQNLADLDQWHQGYWLPGDFIWDESLMQVYPQGDFWFLYGKLKI
jgi:hypothetical protein